MKRSTTFWSEHLLLLLCFFFVVGHRRTLLIFDFDSLSSHHIPAQITYYYIHRTILKSMRSNNYIERKTQDTSPHTTSAEGSTHYDKHTIEHTDQQRQQRFNSTLTRESTLFEHINLIR